MWCMILNIDSLLPTLPSNVVEVISNMFFFAGCCESEFFFCIEKFIGRPVSTWQGNAVWTFGLIIGYPSLQLLK